MIPKQLRFIALALTVYAGASPGQTSAADKTTSFEGTLSATLTIRGTTTQLLFTRKDNQLRIEDAATNKPEPINIVDLASGKLMILFPHNSTFVGVDPMKTPAPPGAPPLPTSFPTLPNIPGASIGAQTGPAVPPPPGFPSPPPLPEVPFGGSPNGAGGAPALAMPMMPPMPAMPGAFGAFDLKKTDKTRTIQGMECTLYTLSDHGQNFEIWAVSDSALFPFRLLQRDYHPRRFGPPMIEEQWVEMLQKKSLFPLEATLRSEPGGQERLSFKVSRIDRMKIDHGDLFSVPKNFYEIQPPPF